MSQDQIEQATTGERLVAQGAQVIQIENTEMRSFALAHKRDEAEVKDRALAILEKDPDAVACAFYSIPYKEHTREEGCTRRSDDPCPVRHVEGIGIDGARELARLWGNNATRVYFSEQDDERIWLSGVFVDLESNTRVEVPFGVSKLGQSRGGGSVYTLNPQRLGMAIQAGVSKAARNAITSALPRSLSRAYFDRAKELLESSAAIKVPQLLAAFEAFDVSRETLEAFYGAKLEELSAEQRKNLRGLFVAIREGLLDPKEHFAGVGGGGGGAPGDTGEASQAIGVTSPPPAPSGKAEVRGGTEAAPPAPAPAPEPAPAPVPEADAPAPAPAEPPASEEAPAPASSPPPEPGPIPAGVARPPEEGDAERVVQLRAVPEPEGSHRTQDGVDSSTPNDDDEPGQPDLTGLGI